MKFFTIDWWMGCQTGESVSVAEAYATHLGPWRDALPPELLRFADTASLHDARLRDVTLDVPTATLMLLFDAYDTSPMAVPGTRSPLRLTYGDVLAFRSNSDPEKGLSGPHGYGDAGYDEIDVATNGHFEHRILFSTGIVLTVVFRHFRYD